MTHPILEPPPQPEPDPEPNVSQESHGPRHDRSNSGR